MPVAPPFGLWFLAVCAICALCRSRPTSSSFVTATLRALLPSLASFAHPLGPLRLESFLCGRSPRPLRFKIFFSVCLCLCGGKDLYRLNSAMPSQINCTAIARIKNPKMRLIAPTAPAPRRSTSGPPNRRKR